MSDLRELYHIGEAVLDTAEDMFLAGLGAAPARMKHRGDFATEIDLSIERYLRSTLQQLTGIPVVGEEFGGDKGSPQWVVDPVDGTANFAAGNPMCAVLLSLIVDDEPVIGLTSVPVTRQRFGAFKGSPLFVNGVAQPPLKEGPAVAAHVGFSSVSSPANSGFSSMLRQGVLAGLTTTHLRPRITGSVGIDLAFTAAGIFEGAVSFSPFLWDNAAGVALVRAAGGVVTDINGDPWVPGSTGAVVGSERGHSTILELVKKYRFPVHLDKHVEPDDDEHDGAED